MEDENRKYIGSEGYITIDGLTIEIIIRNWKRSYGNERFLVEPVFGTGKVWVLANRITFKNNE